MAETKHFDLIVIGGGPGGYVGAIRAGQLGMKVACVERAALGGVCLNWGCIPTKALLHNAELYQHAITHGKEWGIEIDPKHVKVNWEQVIARSRSLPPMSQKGVAFLFKKNKVEHIQGHAKIVSGKSAHGPCKVEVYEADDNYYNGTSKGKPTQTITADKVLIATGAKPRELPFAKFDGETILSSTHAMSMKKQPKSMIIIGSGAIGMEFAYFYNAFGTKVTVVEMVDRILPVEDDDVSKAALKAFQKQGIEFHTSHTLKSVDKTKGGVKATIVDVNDEKKTQTLEAEVILLAVGVTARYDGLFDESLGIKIEKGHIATDYRSSNEPTYKTSVPGIFAIGDVIGPPWLAHVSSEEAVVCVERMAGHHVVPLDYDGIPGCTYCNPQIASIGLTERAAKEKGLEYKVGMYQLKAHGKAMAVGATDGFVKLIVSKKYGEILGAHIIGEDASELIAEMGLAKRLEATAEDIISTVHAHPTMNEAIHEAALATEGRAIHA
ncbi:MAG TPA: dihydrolipoyl dehydrogenase [Phycisphaerales bacterium]|nr:dihydrolipoyl dehydrogenase [Phycisphaerales bacterium]HRQ76051.1 dihydrolipoyl dehydrogenase [Phycisphaerales bacterium]